MLETSVKDGQELKLASHECVETTAGQLRARCAVGPELERLSLAKKAKHSPCRVVNLWLHAMTLKRKTLTPNFNGESRISIHPMGKVLRRYTCGLESVDQ